MKLKLYLADLLVFVPNTNMEEATVLATNALTPEPAKGDQKMTIQSHYPLLLYYSDNLAPQAPPGSDEIVCERLDFQDVSISFITEKSLPPLRFHQPRLPGSSAESFEWVADLDQVLKRKTPVREECFDARPRPELVSARLKLTTGTLKNYRLGQCEGNIYPVEFLSSGTGRRAIESRAASEVLVLEVDLNETDRVVFQRHTFEGIYEPSIELRAAAGAAEIEVAIANTRHLPGQNVPDPEPCGPLGSRSYHTEHLFKLLNTPERFYTQLDQSVSVPGQSHLPRLLDVLRPRRGTEDCKVCNCARAQAHPRA